MSILETLVRNASSNIEKVSPKKWWHWVLMYPGLAIFLLGNVPTVWQLYLSYKNNVPFTQAYGASRQVDYWARNYSDLADGEEFKTEKVVRGSTTLNYRIFKTGDILVSSSTNGDDVRYQWFGFEAVDRSFTSSLLIIDEAFADRWPTDFGMLMNSKRIVCRQRLSGGRIKVRVRDGSERCYDEIIDTGSGRVISRDQVSCSSSCD